MAGLCYDKWRVVSTGTFIFSPVNLRSIVLRELADGRTFLLWLDPALLARPSLAIIPLSCCQTTSFACKSRLVVFSCPKSSGMPTVHHWARVPHSSQGLSELPSSPRHLLLIPALSGLSTTFPLSWATLIAFTRFHLFLALALCLPALDSMWSLPGHPGASRQAMYHH